MDDYNDRFHHWRHGADGGVALHLVAPKVFWSLAQRSKSGLAMRQVWDGADISVNMTSGPGSPCSVKVRYTSYAVAARQYYRPWHFTQQWPTMHPCMAAEVQQHLLKTTISAEFELRCAFSRQ